MCENKAEHRWQRVVDDSDRGVRLDRFWGRELADEGVSRARIKGWIEEGLALVDGDPAPKGSVKLLGGETVVLGAGGPAADEVPPEPVPGHIEPLFEDGHMLMVNKPAGLTVHPAPGEPGPTLVNHLLYQWPNMGAEMTGQRPGIVHRLDRDTSGVMAVALTEADRLKLAECFAEHRARKVYLALVHGCPEPAQGTIDAPMGRHPSRKTCMAVVQKGGREAVSDYRVLWTAPGRLASLVAVRIHTGRTHQIRVHMAHVGHPLLGDAVYGSREQAEWSRRGDRLAPLAPRQMLHAFFLSLPHPVTGEAVTRWLAPPEDFRTLLRNLPRRCMRVGIVGMPGGGKSALLKMLRGLDLPCFSADECVAALYEPGCDGAVMIEQRFGGRFTREDGGVDKRGLFAAMCESDQVRREVDDLVHPMVRHACQEFFTAHRDEPAAFAEVPLLLEGGWHEKGIVDMVVGVHTPREKRFGELRLLRHLPEETMAMFDSWQWSQEDKLAACRLVVDNDAGLEKLKAEAVRVRDFVYSEGQARDQAFIQWMDELWPSLAKELEQEGGA